MYISEHEHFTDFNVTSALFWEQHDLVYGDWTSGENSDGCYEHFAELDIPQVSPPPRLGLVFQAAFSVVWFPALASQPSVAVPEGVTQHSDDKGVVSRLYESTVRGRFLVRTQARLACTP